MLSNEQLNCMLHECLALQVNAQRWRHYLLDFTDSVLTVGYEINNICTCIYNHLLTQFWGPSENGKQDYCKSWPNLQSRNYSQPSKIAFHTYHSLSLTTVKWGRLLVWGRVVKRHILECTTSQKGQTPHSVRVSYLSYTLCWRPLWKYRPLPRALVFFFYHACTVNKARP